MKRPRRIEWIEPKLPDPIPEEKIYQPELLLKSKGELLEALNAFVKSRAILLNAKDYDGAFTFLKLISIAVERAYEKCIISQKEYREISVTYKLDLWNKTRGY